MFERWKPIKDFEDLYEISDWGRVRSLERKVKCKDYTRIVKSRILKLCSDGRYTTVCLSKGNKKKTFLVHRLVAEAFIPNPNNLPEINHKSECKSFNHYSCLEWCDKFYNNRYGTIKDRRVKNNTFIKKINQYSLDGEFIREWPSQTEIARNLGCSLTVIWACCNGLQKTACGHIWKYAS